MNFYVDSHLQQRKSSLSSLSKNRKQSNKILTSSRDLHPNNLFKQTSSQATISQQKTSLKQLNSNQNEKKQTHLERDSSLKKNNSKLRDDQSSDYIRNLYKKYLGKQNKEPSEKLNAFTQRKLRTSESRELLTTNTTAKDFTKRILFTDQQIEVTKPSLMKKQKNKVSTIKYQNQLQNQIDKPTLNNLHNSKTHFQSTKRQSLKKNQKQNFEKQCETKKSALKNQKNKIKVEKCNNEEESKTTFLKRSQSTQLRSEKIDIPIKKALKQCKTTQFSNRLSNQKIKQVRNSLNDGIVHPHRESYCQFDTEQEIQKENSDNHQNRMNQKLQSKKQFEQNFLKDSSQYQCQQFQKNQYKITPQTNRIISSTLLKDLSTLQLLAGTQNPLFQALNRIKNVKNNKKQINQQDKCLSKLCNEKNLRFENKENHKQII